MTCSLKYDILVLYRSAVDRLQPEFLATLIRKGDKPSLPFPRIRKTFLSTGL